MPSAQHSKYSVVSQKGTPYKRKRLGAVIWRVVAFDVPRLLFVIYTGMTTFATYGSRIATANHGRGRFHQFSCRMLLNLLGVARI